MPSHGKRRRRERTISDLSFCATVGNECTSRRRTGRRWYRSSCLCLSCLPSPSPPRAHTVSGGPHNSSPQASALNSSPSLSLNIARAASTPSPPCLYASSSSAAAGASTPLPGALPAHPSSNASSSALVTEVLRTSSRLLMWISRQPTSRLSPIWRLLTTCVLFILRISSQFTPHTRQVNLVLPGPEQPLVDGIEQHFRKGSSTSPL